MSLAPFTGSEERYVRFKLQEAKTENREKISQCIRRLDLPAAWASKKYAENLEKAKQRLRNQLDEAEKEKVREQAKAETFEKANFRFLTLSLLKVRLFFLENHFPKMGKLLEDTL